MKNNLKELREKAEMSMAALGDATGVTAGAICHLEKGKRSPNLKTAYRLSSLLGKSVYDIWPDTTEIIEETVTIRRCVIK